MVFLQDLSSSLMDYFSNAPTPIRMINTGTDAAELPAARAGARRGYKENPAPVSRVLRFCSLSNPVMGWQRGYKENFSVGLRFR